LLDIERRRQAEARTAGSAGSLQRIIEAAPMAITLRDAQTCASCRSTRWRRAASSARRPRLIGCTPEEIFDPAIAVQRRRDMEAALASRRLTQLEYRVDVNGETRVWDARYLPLARPASRRTSCCWSPPTSPSSAPRRRPASRPHRQREMLVKEVHHRIKNNLQGVAGLLQQIAVRKPEMASAISEVVGQVQAIAQVYGLQVGVTGPLRLKSVVEAITTSVQRTFGHPIMLSVEGPAPHQWALPESESIPIALTVNELLTNAVKHSMAGRGLQVSVRVSAPTRACRSSLPTVRSCPADSASHGFLAVCRVLAWCARCCRERAPRSHRAARRRGGGRVTLVPPGISKLHRCSAGRRLASGFWDRIGAQRRASGARQRKDPGGRR
jgi:two-component sensor histidine kinase